MMKYLVLSSSLILAHLVPPTEAIATSKDFLVQGLEEIEPAFGTFDGDMYAGLISVEKDHTEKENDKEDGGKLMFWLFEPESPSVDDSLVIWFNGGPGCSSFHAGLLLEHGPVTTPLHPAGYFGAPKVEPYVPNPHAWTNATSIMYVEQPVGVGFSYGDAPEDEEGVSSDFYNFLQNFYDIFEEQRSKRLFLIGESYAGMYIPSIAHYIYNKNKEKNSKVVNLKGIGLGNGWIDVMTQGPMVIDYAWFHGMIDSVTRDALHVEWEQCKQKSKEQPEPFHKFTVPDECGIMGTVLKASGAGLLDWGGPNTYDVTTFDPYYAVTYPHSANTIFFNNPRVREALHVPKDGKLWTGCIPGEGRRRLPEIKQRRFLGETREKLLLDDDKPESVVPYIAELLDDDGIQVLVYNGDRDLSTNSAGSETCLDGMEWSGAADWANPKAYRRALWMVDDQVAGYAKSVKGLQFVVVYNSGHLVPFNQPVFALDLVTRLLTEKPFGDITIPVVYEAPKTKEKTSGSKENEKRSGLSVFVAACVGFIAGAVSVFVYSALKREQQYEQLGDVEVEEQLTS